MIRRARRATRLRLAALEANLQRRASASWPASQGVAIPTIHVSQVDRALAAGSQLIADGQLERGDLP